MKNYYEELEVSKTASKEVIEKVYKFLAKKYHPDTTKEINKLAAEEKFKIISEAYEVLSDYEKRKKYDLELERSNPTISYEEYLKVVNERNFFSNELNNFKNNKQGYFNQNNINNQTYNNQSYHKCSYNNQAEYNQTNSNFNNRYNEYQKNDTNINSKRKKYYYTDTGEPASVFAYYIYKLREYFSNIGLLILSIIATILFLNALF